MTQQNFLDVLYPKPVPESPRARGHRMARRAAEKVERTKPGWIALATMYVENFAFATETPWLTEEARAFAVRQGLEAPHDWRCFGAVLQGLKRRGVIRAVGTGSAQSSNGSPKVKWLRT